MTDSDTGPHPDSRLDRWRLFVDRRTPDVSRRTLLKAGGAGVGGGAVGAALRGWYPFGAGVPGYVRPGGSPPSIPPALDEDCGFTPATRLDAPETVHWGTFPDESGHPAFELRTENTTYERGDTVSVTLTNVSVLPQRIGQLGVRHNVQLLTEAGWQSVRLTEGETGQFPQTGTRTELPGEIHRWSFPFTGSDIARLHPVWPEVLVCSDLPVGRYRFVCSAVGGWNDGVAVAFDVTE